MSEELKNVVVDEQVPEISIEELDGVSGGVSISTLTSAACPVSTLTSLLP